jgi:hypothetical protein
MIRTVVGGSRQRSAIRGKPENIYSSRVFRNPNADIALLRRLTSSMARRGPASACRAALIVLQLQRNKQQDAEGLGRGGDKIDDGGAANNGRSALFVFPRKSTGGKNPPVKSEESTMTKPTTARSTFPDPAIIAADDAFFAVLLETYPRRDVADQARAALHDVLAEADNAGQLKVCLLDGVNRYVADMRASDKHGFMSLRAFIADGERWRPEYLEFNRRAA